MYKPWGRFFLNFVCFSESPNFNGQIYGGDFAKFRGLLRTYELYYFMYGHSIVKWVMNFQTCR